MIDVDNYEKIERIGEGTYGIVYKSRHKETNELVALKRIRVEESEITSGIDLAHFREIMILNSKSMKHENIINIIDIAVSESIPSLLFLVLPLGEIDLAQLLDGSKTAFRRNEVQCLMYQLASGLDFLHYNYVIHRDLKLSNLILMKDGTLKIADFGLARKFAVLVNNKCQPMTPKVVTLWYRAPELLLGDFSYSCPVDVWSLGCIFGELLLHEPLIPGTTELNQYKLITELIGVPNQRIWPSLQSLSLYNEFSGQLFPPGSSVTRQNQLRVRFPDLEENVVLLLNSMLTYNPDRRITMREVMKHDYFNSKDCFAKWAVARLIENHCWKRKSK